jgi:signal transduction histidine kinase
MCVEAATDYQLLSERDRGLRFTVDSESFGLAGTGVFLDKELINQALNNILDNASKYSYRGTRVLIRLGMSKTGSYLGITNQGIPIRPTEVTKVFERGWRSEDAMLVVGEGTGIGLWIVDNIMKAHGGSVRVISNTARGVTEFRLYLPSTPLHV